MSMNFPWKKPAKSDFFSSKLCRPRISSFPEAHQFVCHCASQVGSMDPDRAVGHHLSDGGDEMVEREILRAGKPPMAIEKGVEIYKHTPQIVTYMTYTYICMYKHSVYNNNDGNNNNSNNNDYNEYKLIMIIVILMIIIILMMIIMIIIMVIISNNK